MFTATMLRRCYWGAGAGAGAAGPGGLGGSVSHRRSGSSSEQRPRCTAHN